MVIEARKGVCMMPMISADEMDEGNLTRRSPVPDADTAFRQSLFDALADDEGAAFWQGVYGQPIHNYPDTKVGPDGKLEQMTEEEYTAYVRRRMWEKSQEGHEEIRQAKAKERREQQRVKEQEQHDRRKRNKRTADSSNSKYDRDIFDFDHRHATRSNEKAWNIRWRDYLQAWQNLDTVASKTNTSVSPNDVPTKPPPSLKTLLSWPNLSNSASDINASELKSFFQHCPPSSTLTSTSSSAPSILLATLKQERIRWHPDKIQHRYGRLGIEIDTKTLARVTAVFQIVDELWIREKEKENEAHGLKDS
ncbi:hypothetical protein UCRPC4_g04244 [Phaeomoniella chlamydospora]|uniref:Uncharacterized protein n=1 Tax=Phaeomoniella chlamydospora TaxID=158046 RepID=A0A0G2GTJ0_PHACM|nr:hypothetical protein UCRPC4_g04244 [Phaeomoniella chlamydospora]